MKIYLRTYGCQMNERDTDNIAAEFVELGCEITENSTEADIVIVNTCSVREQAELKAMGKLGHLIDERRLRHSSFPVIGVTGCMAQNRGENILNNLPQIDFIAGARKTHLVPKIAMEIFNERKAGILQPLIPCGVKNKRNFSAAKVDVSDDNLAHLKIKKHLPQREGTVCAFVSIMQGCDMNCSYCIVPKVRGVQRSRPVADILAEAEELVERGVREITLLGQVVNAFGREIAPKKGISEFVRILQELNNIKGLERIRFTSPHPSYFGDDLIDAYTSLEKLCEYVHLPMQSGSDRILKAMNRPYRIERFLKIVERLRANAPQISISTDVIVGYPDETESDFEKTLQAFKAADFDMAYIFKYSPRAGTRSAELPDSVSEKVKEERNGRLLAELEIQSKKFNDALVGQPLEILVEGMAKRGENMLMGRTRTHRKAVFEGGQNLVGKLVNVRIQSAGISALNGVL